MKLLHKTYPDIKVVVGGAVLISTLMEELGFARLIVSDSDNLEGYAIKRGLME